MYIHIHEVTIAGARWEIISNTPASAGSKIERALFERCGKDPKEYLGKALGVFLKYPQIIPFSRIFPFKPSILGYPHFMETSTLKSKLRLNDTCYFGKVKSPSASSKLAK